MHIDETSFAKTSAPKLIAVTGGIGSGKSFVCDILAQLGYKVYDCDTRAKALMEADYDIKKALATKITPEAINADGTLNRKAIAKVVFSNPAKLAILDKTVHSAVLSDLLKWKERNSSERVLFVETAIPFKSNLYRVVDDIWEICAPEEVRVARAVKRDQSTPEAIRARISNQLGESPSVWAEQNPGFRFHTLVNDGKQPVDNEISKLLETY